MSERVEMIDCAELLRLRDIEAKAKRAASKLAVEYWRRSIQPRDEWDELILAFGFSLRESSP